MLKWTATALAAAFVCSSAHAQERDKEPYCRWDEEEGINAARLAVSDALLLEAETADAAAALREHLPTGMPARVGAPGQNEQLLAQEHFLTWYDDDLRSPLWVAYHFPAIEADDQLGRLDSFRSDPRLREENRSDCADYSEPIFDQGHMVPRAAMNRSGAAMDATFLMSNMTPQHCAFNRGPWQVLESIVRREWAGSQAHSWVVAGTVYDRNGDLVRDDDSAAWRMDGRRGRRVAIPSAQYMIVLRLGNSGFETLSFNLPNTDELISNDAVLEYLANHITTLDQIGQVTGFRFFEGLVVNESTSLWDTSDQFRPSVLTSRCRASYPDY